MYYSIYHTTYLPIIPQNNKKIQKNDKTINLTHPASLKIPVPNLAHPHNNNVLFLIRTSLTNIA